ncbi:Mlc titration factor MtfA (ptsG expression regulator) [Lacibacter cauensis]|uniref:Mlc titration factor MtfA (PtsG expression regulator) n=1 Tax=Lacibacter cauensis TaxID=510947 RepID=A0A562SDL9_9BACT|nr:zinc-dependent peptidase [Lacibacter cauensis]TWI79308.1 Mlc titration factor MtfA (ptsG expression regulator) [Lacibacter cauensis]
MPQDPTPVVITFKDSTYTIYSLAEYDLLPDSVKGGPEERKLIESSFQASTETNDDGLPFAFFWFIAIIILILYHIIKDLKKEKYRPSTPFNPDADNSNSNTSPACYVYRGKELRFSTAELHNVCNKYNAYYNQLAPNNQQLFLERLQQFIRSKDFYIHAPVAYKEMPILVSSSAVQITFGLEDYLLPHFSTIVIHPAEYFAYEPLRVLVGNVQGDVITLSWKHFLHDYQNPTDGKNVGLHEMAHALQVQYLFRKPNRHNDFKVDYEHYDRLDDEVQQNERLKSNRLFDDNALKNKNEFWATSVELFFEKPAELKLQYPKLYDAICVVLNQDPLTV